MLLDKIDAENQGLVQIFDDIKIMRQILVVDSYVELKSAVDIERFAVGGAKHR